MSVSPLNFGNKSGPLTGAALMRSKAKGAVQAPANKTAHAVTITRANVAFCASDVIIKHQGTKNFQHEVMRLYLHGEHAKAHKEQVKEMSVPNEDKLARKRTRATTRDAWVRAEECNKKLHSA